MTVMSFRGGVRTINFASTPAGGTPSWQRPIRGSDQAQGTASGGIVSAMLAIFSAQLGSLA
jgi:hypothetical protein